MMFFFKKIDLKLVKILAGYYSVVVLLNLFKIYWRYQLLSVDIANEEYEIDWYRILVYNIFLDWVIVIGIMIIISYLTEQMINKKIKWKIIIIIHFVISILIGWIIFLIIGIVGYLTGEYKTINDIQTYFSFGHYISVVDLNFLIYTSMLGIILIYNYINQIKKIEAEKAKLTYQLIDAKMKTLKSHLHPHFLFNTLNSISALVETDYKMARNTIANLSDLLREILDHKNHHLISLHEEISLLNKYINIKNVRFSDDLDISLNIEENLNEALVPSLLIQPLVENAIKHGYSKKHLKLKIDINISQKEDLILFEIKNNGKPLQEPWESLIALGSGLQNTIDRLKALYNKNYTFDIQNCEDEVFVKITIPYKIAEFTIYKK